MHIHDGLTEPFLKLLQIPKPFAPPALGSPIDQKRKKHGTGRNHAECANAGVKQLAQKQDEHGVNAIDERRAFAQEMGGSVVMRPPELQA